MLGFESLGCSCGTGRESNRDAKTGANGVCLFSKLKQAEQKNPAG
jgi:hypothetical protein